MWIGPPRLHTGGAKNIWLKKNHHTRRERLKIATYYVITLLKDEHVQELEEELKENNKKWDVIGLGEVRRKEESFTTLQSGHLLYHSEANHGQAGVGFLVKKKWKHNITRVSKQPCHLPEDTGAQLLCAANYAIRCRYLDTDQTLAAENKHTLPPFGSLESFRIMRSQRSRRCDKGLYTEVIHHVKAVLYT